MHVLYSKHSWHTAATQVWNVIKTLRMQLPLKAAMTGEDVLTLVSCAVSAFFRGNPSPDTKTQRNSTTQQFLHLKSKFLQLLWFFLVWLHYTTSFAHGNQFTLISSGFFELDIWLKICKHVLVGVWDWQRQLDVGGKRAILNHCKVKKENMALDLTVAINKLRKCSDSRTSKCRTTWPLKYCYSETSHCSLATQPAAQCYTRLLLATLTRALLS